MRFSVNINFTTTQHNEWFWKIQRRKCVQLWPAPCLDPIKLLKKNSHLIQSSEWLWVVVMQHILIHALCSLIVWVGGWKRKGYGIVSSSSLQVNLVTRRVLQLSFLHLPFDLPLPTPKQPAFTRGQNVIDTSSTIDSAKNCSNNSVTISTTEARWYIKEKKWCRTNLFVLFVCTLICYMLVTKCCISLILF